LLLDKIDFYMLTIAGGRARIISKSYSTMSRRTLVFVLAESREGCKPISG